MVSQSRRRLELPGDSGLGTICTLFVLDRKSNFCVHLAQPLKKTLTPLGQDPVRIDQSPWTQTDP